MAYTIPTPRPPAPRRVVKLGSPEEERANYIAFLFFMTSVVLAILAALVALVLI